MQSALQHLVNAEREEGRNAAVWDGMRSAKSLRDILSGMLSNTDCLNLNAREIWR